MTTIDIIVPQDGERVWHHRIAERLEAAGHRVRLRRQAVGAESALLDRILDLDARLFGLDAAALFRKAPDGRAADAPTADPTADIVVDLTLAPAAPSVASGARILRLAATEGDNLTATAAAVAAGRLPDLFIVDDGGIVASARPMIDNRVSLARGLEDVLARAVSLVAATGERATAGPLAAIGAAPPRAPGRSFGAACLTGTLPRLAAEALRRRRYRSAHWRVGWRLIEGRGVAERGSLDGTPWQVLPDDGTRFFADPFAWVDGDRRYIFVEDWSHAERKAVISVAEIDADGRASAPRMVLEEPHHLSYPQVFAHRGEVFMLPEASAGRTLILYRAARLPDRWTRHAVLIAGRELSDATLLEKDGAWWLFATDRDGAGSTSDLMVAYRAPELDGPWQPHRANPLLIDRSRARPGGGFVTVGGRLLLPVQDGTLGYGGGLGLAELTRLDDTAVTFAPPRPIDAGAAWPYPRIHTLNRMGPLEVIDGIAAVRR